MTGSHWPRDCCSVSEFYRAKLAGNTYPANAGQSSRGNHSSEFIRFQKLRCDTIQQSAGETVAYTVDLSPRLVTFFLPFFFEYLEELGETGELVLASDQLPSYFLYSLNARGAGRKTSGDHFKPIFAFRLSLFLPLPLTRRGESFTPKFGYQRGYLLQLHQVPTTSGHILGRRSFEENEYPPSLASIYISKYT